MKTMKKGLTLNKVRVSNLQAVGQKGGNTIMTITLLSLLGPMCIVTTATVTASGACKTHDCP
ncbi:MAG: hypothetical protein ACEPOW_06055 [Bacteroidales bacterium]